MGSRILVVEDETDLAELVAINLRGAGHEVTVAHDGKTAFLVRRAVRLITSGRTDPGRLLTLTFSRRAASDLAHRIA